MNKTMRQHFSVLPLIFIALFFTLPDTRSENDNQSQTLRNSLEQIVNTPIVRNGDAGILIWDIRSDRAIFEYQPDKSLIPASNMKVFTTAAALGILGPEFEFTSEVYIDGTIQGTTLTGDLILYGGGDPFFVPEELWKLAKSVRNSGITRIDGNLIIDESFFDNLRIPDSDWERIKMPLWYNAPTGALAFNFNTVTVMVSPGKAPGDPLLVNTDPASSYFKVQNDAITGKPKSANNLVLLMNETDDICTISLKGKLPKDYHTQEYFRHIENSGYYCGISFVDYLMQNGVTITGKVKTGIKPEKVKHLVSQESAPLASILRDAMKFSNNFMMEQTLKTLGAIQSAPPGSTASGIQAATEFFTKTAGLNMQGFEMSDGSGLSRNNHVSARQMTDLFRYILGESTFGPEFMNCLPVAGIDGTLRRRLKNDDRCRLVRAKTGLVDNVSCLSGVVDGRNGNGLIFSILMNKTQNRHGDAKKTQDNIIRALLNYWSKAGEQ